MFPDKAQARRWARQIHGERSSDERAMASELVSARVAERLTQRRARVVVGYVALASELDPVAHPDAVHASGIRLLAPRVDGEHLRLHDWETARERHPLGVSQPLAGVADEVDPRTVDAVIVPGLAFSVDGHRLGRGRGFYDRFLASVPGAWRIGIAADELVVAALPVEEHDEVMDEIVTPSRVWAVPRRSSSTKSRSE
jgi:5-formyltetrahydrofolate cyclo-ligase